MRLISHPGPSASGGRPDLPHSYYWARYSCAYTATCRTAGSASFARSIATVALQRPAIGRACSGHDGQPPPALIGWPSRFLWLGIGASCALAGGAAGRSLRVWLLGAPLQAPVEGGVECVRTTPAGVDFAGAALPSSDERALANATPLSLKRGCAWGVPGGSPYRGTVEQARSLRQASGRCRAGARRKGRTRLEPGPGGNLAQRHPDAGRQAPLRPRHHRDGFRQHVVLQHPRELQTGPRGVRGAVRTHRQPLAPYTVMVPYVCRNVSVLGQRGNA